MAIAFKSSASDGVVAATTSKATTFAIATGDDVFVGGIESGGVTSVISNVTDTGGNSYSRVNVHEATSGSSHNTVDLWHTKATASATGITTTYANTTAVKNLLVWSYTGGGGLGLNATAGAKTTNPTISLAMAGGGDFIVALIGAGAQQTATPQNGTQRATTTVQAGIQGWAYDNTNAAAQTLTDSFTVPVSTIWSAVAVDLESVSAMPPLLDKHRSGHIEVHPLANL